MHIEPMRNVTYDPEDGIDSDLIFDNPTAQTPFFHDPDGHMATHDTTASSSDTESSISDVFASSRPGSPRNDAGGMRELSEYPRLQREHATNGYRDGVTEAKATSIQGGFDEGFSIGAKFGGISGKLRGMLEGIEESVGQEAPEEKGLEELVVEAQAELSVEKIFGVEYWNGDGTWKYEVPGEDKDDVTFQDVARAHPLVIKWEAKVKELMEEWGVKWRIAGREGDEDRIIMEEEAERRVLRNVAPPTSTPRNVLDW